MEILKGIFFFMTAILAILMVRGETIFTSEVIEKLYMIAMP
jgi:hypothetical protein